MGFVCTGEILVTIGIPTVMKRRTFAALGRVLNMGIVMMAIFATVRSSVWAASAAMVRSIPAVEKQFTAMRM